MVAPAVPAAGAAKGGASAAGGLSALEIASLAATTASLGNSLMNNPEMNQVSNNALGSLGEMLGELGGGTAFSGAGTTDGANPLAQLEALRPPEVPIPMAPLPETATPTVTPRQEDSTSTNSLENVNEIYDTRPVHGCIKRSRFFRLYPPIWKRLRLHACSCYGAEG